MKFIQDKDSLTIDGHEWMRMLRFPYYTVAKIRNMKVRDELSMFEFAGPSCFKREAAAGNGCVCAKIQRMSGKRWKLEVFWMAHVGKTFKRGVIWSWVFFRLEPGSLIRILPESVDDNLIRSEQVVRKVCRLANRLTKMAEKAGDRQSMAQMMAYPRQFYDLPDKVPYISFLDSIAAPLLD